MPELSSVAAVIDAGEVVLVAALSTDNDYSGWVEAMKADHDDVLIVKHAGIGWKVTPDGLRPDKPYESWVWDDKNGWWDSPIEYPTDGGIYTWDEAAQGWVPAA